MFFIIDSVTLGGAAARGGAARHEAGDVFEGGIVVQLGFENKKQTTWAIVLGVLAVIAVAYEFIPMFTGSSTPASNAQAAAPVATATTPSRLGPKAKKKPRVENLDPTLRLDLLALSEQTLYEGNGRNIFVSQAEEVVIPKPGSSGTTDAKPVDPGYQPTPIPPPPADSVEVLWLRQFSGRAEKNLPEAGRRCFRGGRRRDRGPALQGDSHFAHVGGDSGHGVQRAAAEYPADARVRKNVSGH